MSDLRTLPAIRAEAERLAREVYEAQSKTLHANGMGPSLLWELLPERTRSAYVDGHLDLLCDLTRPASRDVVARLVAAKVGLDTAGGVVFSKSERRVKVGRRWKVDRAWILVDHNVNERVMLETSDVTDPAEALRLIATHVLRGPDV